MPGRSLLSPSPICCWLSLRALGKAVLYFPHALTCKKPSKSSVENTSITSTAPALALLTIGVSGQL